MQAVRHRTWIWLGKALLAGVIAFIALTLFCMLYLRMPVHFPDEEGSTDYHWESHARYSLLYEGYGHGVTNNEGYVNTFDHSSGQPVDVLILGSSHMEGFQVSIDDVTVTRLNALLGDKTAYNIGMQGHSFFSCVGNLESAVKEYRPSSYVVIEVDSVKHLNEKIAGAVGQRFSDKASHTTGILYILQQNPYFRLIYRQLQSYFSLRKPEATAPASAYNDPALLSSLLAQLADDVSISGAKLIIAYHPQTELQPDGSILLSTDPEAERSFAEACEENGVLFLDMGERFLAEYEQSHILPYGFSNTSVGAGHLNRYGHEMMAEELYALMQEVGL